MKFVNAFDEIRNVLNDGDSKWVTIVVSFIQSQPTLRIRNGLTIQNRVVLNGCQKCLLFFTINSSG